MTSQESTVTNLTRYLSRWQIRRFTSPSQQQQRYGCRSNNNINAGHDHHRIQLTLLPLIQKTGNLQLQMNFNCQIPQQSVALRQKTETVTSNAVYQTAFTEPEGQSERRAIIVVTGFDQNNTTTSKAGTFTQQIHYLVVHKPGKMNAARLYHHYPDFPVRRQQWLMKISTRCASRRS